MGEKGTNLEVWCLVLLGSCVDGSDCGRGIALLLPWLDFRTQCERVRNAARDGRVFVLYKMD